METNRNAPRARGPKLTPVDYNPFDQFDAPASTGANPFDQFDAAPAASSGNPFDQFDAPAKAKLGLADRATVGLANFASATGDAVTGVTEMIGPASREAYHSLSHTIEDTRAQVAGALPDLGVMPDVSRRQEADARAAAFRERALAMGASREAAAVQGQFDDNSVGYHAAGLTRSLPMMGAAIGVTALTKSPLAGAAVTGVTTGAQQQTQLRAEGEDYGTAATSGAIHGAIEAGMNYITLGVAKYGIKPMTDKLSKAVGSTLAKKVIGKATATGVRRTALAGAAGAGEEVLTTTGQMASDEILLDRAYTLDDYVKGWRDSAIQAGIMSAGAYGVTTPLRDRTERALSDEERDRIDAVLPAADELQAAREGAGDLLGGGDLTSFGDRIEMDADTRADIDTSGLLADIAERSAYNAGLQAAVREAAQLDAATAAAAAEGTAPAPASLDAASNQLNPPSSAASGGVAATATTSAPRATAVTFTDRVVTRAARETGADVVAVETFDDIPGAARAGVEPAGVSALYGDDGRVYVVRSAQKNGQQTIRDITHELTHKGVRAFLRDDYDATMQAVATFARRNPRSVAGTQLQALQAKYSEADDVTLGDEVLAHLSEGYRGVRASRLRKEERGFIAKTVDTVRDFMRRLGYARTMSDDEVFSIIKEAHSSIRQPSKARAARKVRLPRST